MSPLHRFVTGDLVDHHCHGLVQRELDRLEFESLLNEGTAGSALSTSTFDSMIGLAVRRWCAPVLDLPAHAGPDAYIARRRDLGTDEVNRRFMASAGVSDLVVDTGYLPEPVSTPDELGALAGGTGHEVVRLEALAESLLGSGIKPESFPDELADALRTTEAVAAKSIAAYRVGLSLPSVKPGADELVEALPEDAGGSDGRLRIAHPVVNAYLAWTAIEIGLPLQFHVGYGDSDVDMLECDPLKLTAFLRATQEHGVPVMLLHNYPFHRNASYLAQVFNHVFMDVGLAVHNTGALSRAVIRESLELVPFGKMLYSSDAFGLAELYYLGSVLFRRGLSGALQALVEDGEMTANDAEQIAVLVGSANARRVYRLDARTG